MENQPTPTPVPVADAPAAVRPRLTQASILTAIVATGLSAGWGEAFHGTFQPGDSQMQVLGRVETRPTPEAINAATGKNAVLIYGAMSAAVGLGLGLAGGWAGGSMKRGVVAGLLGAVVGLAGAAAVSFPLVEAYDRYLMWYDEHQTENLYIPLAIHAGLWAPAGLAGGLALAVGFGRRRILLGLIGGLAGGLVATTAYELVGALTFPAAKTTQPFAEEPLPRIFGHLFVGVLVAVLASFAIQSEVRRRKDPIAKASPG